MNKQNTIVLFDVDGTLTPARREVSQEVLVAIKELRGKVTTGFVGGSDLAKQKEQLGESVLEMFDYCFSENGLTAYKMGKQLASQTFIAWLGQEKYNRLVNFILRYIADLDLPIKRGTFVEFRNGMINVSPIGRNCSTSERDAYEVFDKQNDIRPKFVEALKKEFSDYGWDKTYCLRHLEGEGFSNIHFFGDKTFKGGNDYEIYESSATIGHAVTSPDDTLKIIKELWP